MSGARVSPPQHTINSRGTMALNNACLRSPAPDSLTGFEVFPFRRLSMGKEVLDTTGLPYPKVVITIAVKTKAMQPGDVLEIVGDCTAFEDVVRDWCRRLGKVWLAIKEDVEKRKTIWIQV